MRGSGLVLAMGAAVLFLAATPLFVAAEDSPQVVYSAYIQCQRVGDLDGMAKHTTEAKAKQLVSMPDAQKQQISEMMKMMAPSEYVVITEDIQGDSATLKLKAKMTDFGGDVVEQEGTVTFVKENGKWKLVQETWSSSCM